LDIARHAVARLHQCRAYDRALGHFEAFRVEEVIDAVPEMKKIFRHQHFQSSGGSTSELRHHESQG
jgi:hypothetical protein